MNGLELGSPAPQTVLVNKISFDRIILLVYWSQPQWESLFNIILQRSIAVKVNFKTDKNENISFREISIFADLLLKNLFSFLFNKLNNHTN